jgi:UPF0755 protein
MSKSKRSFPIALAIVLTTLVIAFLIVNHYVRQALSYPDRRHAGDGTEVAVTIEKGMNFSQISNLLADQDVVDKPKWFRLYGLHRGAANRVRAGDYVLNNNMTAEEVIDKLLEGVKDITVKVTIPEGANVLDVVDAVVAAGIAERAELEAAIRDPALLEKLGIDGGTLEGYLFPETYLFRKPTPAKVVLSKMVEQHRLVWDRVKTKHAKRVAKVKKDLEWTDRDILVMASIVEKEAAVQHEQTRIAQVFINRLISRDFNSRLLQTDPTIRYGCMVPRPQSKACSDWDTGAPPHESPRGRLRRAQLDDKDNRYNTYQHKGLPPGPIANPGENALAATVNGDQSKYLYFVSTADNKTHIFAKTRKEHERNVREYVKKRHGN